MDKEKYVRVCDCGVITYFDEVSNLYKYVGKMKINPLYLMNDDREIIISVVKDAHDYDDEDDEDG